MTRTGSGESVSTTIVAPLPRLVTLEQLEVERLLRQYRSQHFHERALEQINWLLQWAHSLARPLRHCLSIRVYRQVLGHMRARLGASHCASETFPVTTWGARRLPARLHR